MEITPLGDCAVLVRVAERFQDAPEETLEAVLDAQRRLEKARLPGVIEIAPAYTTLGVFYDPTRVKSGAGLPEEIFDALSEQIRKAISEPLPSRPAKVATRLIDIPVCYEQEFGLDLEGVAQRAGVHRREVVDLHCGGEYRVNCIGFTPGFPFLSGLPAKLATPRRSTPRKEIPAGSVAIGGWQTGIYPVKSPGGWNLIGRTALRLFDPGKNPPALLQPGDRIRFRSISREEFERATQ